MPRKASALPRAKIFRAKNNTPPKLVKFDYIKSKAFRVLHVDGAWGGITPNLNIHMSVFSERHPIPQQIVVEVAEDGVTKELPDRKLARDGMVREVDADLVMDLPTAAAIYQWLGEKIKELDALVQKQVKKTGEK